MLISQILIIDTIKLQSQANKKVSIECLPPALAEPCSHPFPSPLVNRFRNESEGDARRGSTFVKILHNEGQKR